MNIKNKDNNKQKRQQPRLNNFKKGTDKISRKTESLWWI